VSGHVEITLVTVTVMAAGGFALAVGLDLIEVATFEEAAPTGLEVETTSTGEDLLVAGGLDTSVELPFGERGAAIETAIELATELAMTD
jgi:hypothetical protein